METCKKKKKFPGSKKTQVKNCKVEALSSGQVRHIDVFQAPNNIVTLSVNSPVIAVDVFRISTTNDMVDTGAKTSVICQSFLSGRTAFAIRPPVFYRNIDGSAASNVVGETLITVRYKGVLIDLHYVAVVQSLIYPLVLGIKWIVQSGQSGLLECEKPTKNRLIRPIFSRSSI